MSLRNGEVFCWLALVATLLSFPLSSHSAVTLTPGGDADRFNRTALRFTDGATVFFDCIYITDELQFSHFAHNGVRVMSGDDDRFRFFQPNRTFYQLTIVNMIPSDAGTWGCVVMLRQTMSPFSRSVRIEYQPRMMVTTPNWSHLYGADNRSLTLPCAGQYIQYRKWMKGRFGAPAVTDDERITVLDDGSLHFKTVSLVDQGEFICIPHDFFSLRYILHNVTVIAPLNVSVAKEPQGALSENGTLNLTCVSSGHPDTHNITWYRASTDTVVKPDNSSVFAHHYDGNDGAMVSILQFTAVTTFQQDTYLCCGANSVATSCSNAAKIHISGLPEASPNPQLQLINISVVLLTLHSPNDTGNLPITRYQVSYGEDGSADVFSEFFDTTVDSYPIYLQLGRTYCFTVSAYNSNGKGQPSDRSCITTQTTVPDAPVSVIAINSTTNHVYLRWSGPESNSGGTPLHGFIAYYRQKGVPLWQSTKIDVTAISTDCVVPESVGSAQCYEYWLDQLIDNKDYWIMLCAENKNGCSANTSAVDASTEQGLPDEPTKPDVEWMEGADEAQVTWMASVAGQPIQQYVLFVTEVLQERGGESRKLEFNRTSITSLSDGMERVTVADLNPSSCYRFSLQFCNTLGSGLLSEPTDPQCASVRSNANNNVAKSSNTDPSPVLIVAFVVPCILIILVVTATIFALCKYSKSRRKRHGNQKVNMADYKRQSSHDSTVVNGDYYNINNSSAAQLVSYNHHGSYDSQRSNSLTSSQLGTPNTVHSFVTNPVMFNFSSGALLDPIVESPVYPERPRQPTPPVDGDVMWTIGPAGADGGSGSAVLQEYDDTTVPRSPTFPDSMQYTDNDAYQTVSHNNLLDQHPTIVSDGRNDGKEMVVLSSSRGQP